MKLWPFEKKALSINQVIDRIEAINQVKAGVSVTPENCERSPTVKAIVQAISRRVAVSPVHVYQKSSKNGHDVKQALPKHPAAALLARPNPWQTRVNFWLDMTSQLVRYNNCYCWLGKGRTGPVRRMIPLQAGETSGELDENLNLSYTNSSKAANKTYPPEQIFHARGAARDFINGDSPVRDIAEAIGMEIAAEEYGATFFGNGAIPMLVFQLLSGFKEWKSDEERDAFMQAVKDKLSGSQRFKAFFLPKGIELADKSKYSVDPDKVQFVDARKYQRTVIAGAFGVPPNYVGDLERATYNNVEQQTIGFTTDVILPYVRMLEAALERDILTQADRDAGVIIRFNLNAIQRADFKSQQEGLQIMRLNGTINANEWRERVELNPINDESGGEDYWRPSNYQLPGEQPNEAQSDEIDSDSTARAESTQNPTD